MFPSDSPENIKNNSRCFVVFKSESKGNFRKNLVKKFQQMFCLKSLFPAVGIDYTA